MQSFQPDVGQTSPTPYRDQQHHCSKAKPKKALKTLHIIIVLLCSLCLGLLMVTIVFATRSVTCYRFNPKEEFNVKDLISFRPIKTVGSYSMVADNRYVMDDNLRLPTSLSPDHYTLTFRPDFYHSNPDDFNLQGRVEIRMTVEEGTSSIVMHKRGLTVVESTLEIRDNSDNSLIPWTETRINPDTEFYIIDLLESLTEGSVITVSMDYYGPLLNDMAGIFYTSYEENGNIDYLVATQFAAIEARKAFPCFDQTDFKSSFQVNIWRQEPYVAISNMPIIETEQDENGWVLDHFDTTNVIMPTYLLAFGVAKYTFIENEADTDLKTQMRIWGRPSAINEGAGNYALSIAGPILSYYEDYFDHTYLLPKNDHFAINDLPYGAMENWGFVVYREERLLRNPDYDVTSDFYGQTSIIAHEIAHMWVGNIVTCAWWNDMFLNEGFASFYDFFGSEFVHPEWDLEQIYVYDSMRYIMGEDSKGTARALTAPVETLAEIGNVYNALNYQKGAGVIRMLSEVMGSDVFKTAMREYIDTYQYAAASHSDWLDVMDDVAADEGLDLPITLTELMRPFLRQAGFPLVTMDTSTGVTSQELFLALPYKGNELPPSEYNYRWHIPFTYVTSWAPEDEVYFWIPINQDNIDTSVKRTDASSWVIANSRYMGFYLVNYDLANWNSIIQQLKTNYNIIHTINRCQVIHDSFVLSRAEILPQIIGLEMTEYLTQESEYIPFACLQDNLPYLDHILSNDLLNNDYKTYMKNMITPSYDRLGWDKPDNQPLFDAYHRSLSIRLSCYYGNTECHNEAVSRFDIWYSNPSDKSLVHPDDRANVYCYGLMHNNDHVTLWDDVLQMYADETRSDEKDNLRDALYCSEEEDILQNLFDMCTQEDSSVISSSDESVIVSNLARNPLMRDYVWNQLDAEWETINHRESALTAMVETFSTEEESNMLTQFIEDHPADNEDDQQYYDDLVLDMNANTRWRDNNYDDIENWLTNVLKR